MLTAGEDRKIIIRIENKTFTQPGGKTVPVLQNVELNILEGEVVVVFGSSGCGKTTLLNLIAGLDVDFQGSIELGTQGNGIGYVFQEPRLLPWLTVEDNLRLVGENNEEAISSVLEAVGLADSHQTYPNRLSLGMARRAALARALAINPALLIMDEPFVSLDENTAVRLRNLLTEILELHKPTVLFVTHDLKEAVTLADRVLFLKGSPAQVAEELKFDTPRIVRGPEVLADYEERARTLLNR
ncbi:MAG: ABC transporter ATP-binding protein [Rhodospirillales bacterium]|nr:ABC transporter ATP-binding protein [Rhodospirillales bacterium]